MARLTKKARVSLRSKKINQPKAVSSSRVVKQRDLTMLAAIRGECLMSSSRDNSNAKHYTRKSKHRTNITY
jgi:hypothetical protein